jgi:hypothetical protein
MRQGIWFIAIAVLVGLAIGLAVLVRAPLGHDGRVMPASSTPARIARPAPVITAGPSAADAATPRDRTGPAVPEAVGDAPARKARSPRAVGPFEIRDHLEAVFRDSAAATTRDLALALEAELPGTLPAGSQLRSLECRSGFCRIEVSQVSELTFGDFMTRAFGPRSSKLATGPVFGGPLGAPTPGESFVAVVFVAEHGATLPVPDSAERESTAARVAR